MYFYAPVKHFELPCAWMVLYNWTRFALQLLLHTGRWQAGRVGAAALCLRHPLLMISKEEGAFPAQVNTSAIEDKLKTLRLNSASL